MKLKEFVTVHKNKLTKQIFFNARKRELKKYGLSPDELLEIDVLIKFDRKKYEKENKERIKTRKKEYQKEYNQRLEVKIGRRERQRRYDQRPEVKRKRKKYMKEYKQKPEIRERINKYLNGYITNRRKDDLNFRITMNLRNRFYTSLKKYSKTGKIMSLKEYGIDMDAIIKHLKPFPKDIENYEVDHIIPLNKFDFNNKDGSTNLEEVKKAWTPKNLQWLTMKKNREKGAKDYT